ncbi:MAG: type II/IV secretion system ATPase subunit, partial [Nanoarchaeota archaeon]
YHMMPPEFKLSEDKQELLDMARNLLIEHKPRAEEFIDPERMRVTFFNIGKDLLHELADRQGVKLNVKELDELTSILVRYTVGFGLLEVLLQDEKIQDITINGPIGVTPIFIVHQKYDECVTNIIPSTEDAENWATKFRILSGRSLDEANPILDTELTIPGARARVAIVGRPLNPKGLAYAFRRHRDKPWTLPLFIENRMISPLGAGLMSFLVDGARTLLVAGTRSSGKTSFLGSLLVEIMRKYRLITVEDTMELSVDAMRELGYNIQPLKVRSALVGGANEVSAEEGIRAALRMGDSALIVGEIRSLESKALYEAMRIGALANVVAGTIHGDSPYGVYDRVVNDLGVPKTSFKATDIIVVCNPVKSADGLSKW